MAGWSRKLLSVWTVDVIKAVSLRASRIGFGVLEVRNLAVYTLFVESDLPMTFGAAHPTAGRRHGSAQIKPDEIQATISPEFAFIEAACVPNMLRWAKAASLKSDRLN